MESIRVLTSKLVPILNDHHVGWSAHEGYLRIRGTDVQMQAFGYPADFAVPKGALIQLDVRVRSQRLLQDRTLIESWAGYGDDTDEAIRQAFDAFSIDSLPAILAVFVDRNLEPDQVEWDTWGSGNRMWEVCLGRLTTMNSGTEAVKVRDYGSYVDALRDAYLREASHELHWLRVFRGVSRGSPNGECVTGEVLLDNEPWQAGLDILDRWQWPTEPHLYRIREFMIAVPVVPEKKWWKF